MINEAEAWYTKGVNDVCEIIDQFEKAYPISVFPIPTGAPGESPDRFAAHGIRNICTTVKTLAQDLITNIFLIRKLNPQNVNGGSALLMAAPNLLEALERIEWSANLSGVSGFCPECSCRASDGHASYCYLAAALKKAKGQ
jgi:hypothetical protein